MIRGLLSLFVVSALGASAFANPGDPMPPEEAAKPSPSPTEPAPAKAEDPKFEVVKKDAPVAAKPDKATKSKHKSKHKARKHKKSHRKTKSAN
ncbi:MAG TPA: hypothetical protein VGC41_28510 [Kofleriaceae bacterium]